MAKKRPSPTTCAPGQGSFFDAPAEVPLPGFGLRLRESLVETLALARERLGLDRHDIAAEMGRLDPEREISKAMLDRYCAPSAAEWRLPAEALPALVRVTGDARCLHLINEAAGYRAVPHEAAAIAELAAIELEERALRERRARVQRMLPREAAEFLREASRRAARNG